MAGHTDFNALRAQTLGAGHDEEAVTVNTRALIDKVLARYSGEWTVLRELLQNAADASASKVIIKFETLPSSTVSLPAQPSPAALLKHTIQHHTLKRLVVTNDGNPFGANDWSRLKRIAEGNPDETKIGAFGVGFYSVFSDCEEPLVRSGGTAMTFYWKGNQLFTKVLRLPEAQASRDTTFVLDYRSPTTAVPALLPLCQFLASSLTFVGLAGVELWVDEWRLFALDKLSAPARRVPIPRSLETKTSEGLMKIDSIEHQTVQLSAKWLKIVGWDRKAFAAPVVGTHTASAKQGHSSHSLRSFFSKFAAPSSNEAAEKAAREEQAAQQAIVEDLTGDGSATIFLNVSTAAIATGVSKTFAQELERATKKTPPKTTKLAVLTTSHNTTHASDTAGGSQASKVDVFATVLPSTLGRIFIGFPTHQTTGLRAHISAPSVIPTVERESIDLNARWVRTWNMEMLRTAGIVCRVAWMNEMATISDEIKNSLSREGRSKIRKDDVDKVLPSAVHLLNQFTFRESTPASQVGQLVEEAFWTCNRTVTIECLSNRGVLPSENIRIATDELSFVDGIPVVPSELFQKARPFVSKLVDFGIITEVTTADIKRELERQALDEKQFAEFLSWLCAKTRKQDIDIDVTKSLLSATIVNDNESGKVLLVGQFRQFLNPSKIPSSMPVPSDTVPFKFTKSVDRKDLEAIGWQDLQIVPWLKFLLALTDEKGELPPEQRINSSPEMPALVLQVVSKQWDGLSQSSKATTVNLLAERTVVPTKRGLMKPGDSYFPSVKLFDDLPVITVPHLKDKFLTALGVRKTVQLNIVFERLVRTKEKDATNSAWSHVELIRYLASVRSDIPKDELKKLRDTPICPAEREEPARQYKLSDLYEPKQELRVLGLRILQWPGTHRSSSEEGKFMKSLGLREFPNSDELISIIAAATTDSKFDLRDRGLRHLVDYHHTYGYSSQQIGQSKIAFLPLEGAGHETATPSMCYTEARAAFMGFQILRSDLHPHAAKLGVRQNPPIDECAYWLVRNPPQTQRDARHLFEYFSTRLSELTGKSLTVVTNARIVPVPINSTSSSNEKRAHRLVHPSMCFLGSGGRYAQIFDYVDFGPSANPFLMHCGSKHEPSVTELATTVVREPARIFSMFERVDQYLDIITSLAKDWSTLKKNRDLVRAMKASAFLPASKESSASKTNRPLSLMSDADYEEDEETVRTWQLASASKITIIDDPINYRLFKSELLAAPFDDDVENFYIALGAQSLSNIIDERPRFGAPSTDQAPALHLRNLVLERLKLFYHDVQKDQIKRNPAWIEKNVEFIAVPTIRIHKSLKGHQASLVEKSTAISDRDRRLWFVPGSKDLFNVSHALLQIMLNRSLPNQAIVLTTLLETDLNKLRARGYDVSRILRKREVEARIAEEQRRKQLAEEQQQLEEARSRHSQQLVEQPLRPPMPGVFPESNEDHAVSGDSGAGPLGGFMSSLFGHGPRATDAGPPQLPIRPVTGPTQDAHTPNKPVTSPEQLRRNLMQAIRSTRAHDSQQIVSDRKVDDVQETKTFCDAKPAQNISLFGGTRDGIKVFLSNDMTEKPRFWLENMESFQAFESVLFAVADAMQISRQSLHIFSDEDSETIAFNKKGSLFCNYRYFYQLHLAEMRRGQPANAVIYWFVTLCHEVAHNLVADHSSAHSFYTESFVAQFFTPIAVAIAYMSPAQENAPGQAGPPSEAPPPLYIR